jgi:hypothetical protein
VQAPIQQDPLATNDGAVRIVVLWNACYGISAAEDARWVREETAKLATCNGVARSALHHVESAAVRYPRAWDWCLELDLDKRETPNAFVRRPPCSEFLADLRLLGTRPTIFVLPRGAS